jgi:hypothetical protein
MVATIRAQEMTRTTTAPNAAAQVVRGAPGTAVTSALRSEGRRYDFTTWDATII